MHEILFIYSFDVVCCKLCAAMCGNVGVQVCKPAKTVIVLAHQVCVPKIISHKHEKCKISKAGMQLQKSCYRISVAKERCTLCMPKETF